MLLSGIPYIKPGPASPHAGAVQLQHARSPAVQVDAGAGHDRYLVLQIEIHRALPYFARL
jgi:hypothetical protein